MRLFDDSPETTIAGWSTWRSPTTSTTTVASTTTTKAIIYPAAIDNRNPDREREREGCNQNRVLSRRRGGAFGHATTETLTSEWVVQIF